MRVRVRLFALLRETLGPTTTREISPGTTIKSVWQAIVRDHPDLREVPVRFAIREAYVEDDHVLTDGDELAVFPPVSGG